MTTVPTGKSARHCTTTAPVLTAHILIKTRMKQQVVKEHKIIATTVIKKIGCETEKKMKEIINIRSYDIQSVCEFI